MHVQLTKTFQNSLGKLTNQEQAAVKRVPTDFMLNAERPGHRLHPVQGAFFDETSSSAIAKPTFWKGTVVAARWSAGPATMP